MVGSERRATYSEAAEISPPNLVLLLLVLKNAKSSSWTHWALLVSPPKGKTAPGIIDGTTSSRTKRAAASISSSRLTWYGLRFLRTLVFLLFPLFATASPSPAAGGCLFSGSRASSSSSLDPSWYICQGARAGAVIHGTFWSGVGKAQRGAEARQVAPVGGREEPKKGGPRAGPWQAFRVGAGSKGSREAYPTRVSFRFMSLRLF